MYFLRSSALIFPPTSSSGVLGFPLPAIEWPMLQCCAVYTCCPLAAGSAPGLAASSALEPLIPNPRHSATATARLDLIARPPRRSGDTGGLRYHSWRAATRRRRPAQPRRDRLEDTPAQHVEVSGEVVTRPRDGDHADSPRQPRGERQDLRQRAERVL